MPSDLEAIAAAATALGIGVVEDETGGEVVLHPVHGRSDQIEDRRAVDIEGAAGSFDLLVELGFFAYIVDRIGKARTAAAGRRQLHADGDRKSTRLKSSH